MCQHPSTHSRRAPVRSVVAASAFAILLATQSGAVAQSSPPPAPITKAGATKQVGLWSVDGWNRGKVGSHCSAERSLLGAAPGGGSLQFALVRLSSGYRIALGAAEWELEPESLLPGRADRPAGPATHRRGHRREPEGRHRRPRPQRRDDAAARPVADDRGQDLHDRLQAAARGRLGSSHRNRILLRQTQARGCARRRHGSQGHPRQHRAGRSCADHNQSRQAQSGAGRGAHVPDVHWRPRHVPAGSPDRPARQRRGQIADRLDHARQEPQGRREPAAARRFLCAAGP